MDPYLYPAIATVIIAVTYAIFSYRQVNGTRKTMVLSLLRSLSVHMLTVGSAGLLFFIAEAPDGIPRVIGVFYYGVAAMVMVAMLVLMLSAMRSGR